LLIIDNKLSSLPIWRYTAVAGSDAINKNYNVYNNKVIFSAVDRVIIKLLRQEKEYGAIKFIVEFLRKP